MNEKKPTTELELYLIRHAQSFSNLPDADISNLPVNEVEDPLLTEAGTKQAKLLGKELQKIRFDAVYSSCLKRTVLTAKEIIANQNDLTLLVNPLFSEVRTPLSYRGSSLEELQSLFSKTDFAENSDLSQGLIMGSEADTDADIQKRAKAALDYFRSKYHGGEKVALVSHGGFLTHIVFYLLGHHHNLPEGVDIEISNTGVTKVTFFKKGTNRFGETILDYINNTSHLNNMI